MGCGICFENWVSALPLAFLSCGHVFHQGCFDQWYQNRQVCPTCLVDEPAFIRIYMDFQTELDELADLVNFLKEIEDLLVQLRNVFEPPAVDNPMNAEANNVAVRDRNRRRRFRPARFGRHGLVARPTNGFLRIRRRGGIQRFVYRRLWKVAVANV